MDTPNQPDGEEPTGSHNPSPEPSNYSNPSPNTPQPEDAPTAEEAYEAVFGHKPSESAEELAKSMLQDALVGAVQTITETALNAAQDRLRFEAAKYITEWNLGKPGDKGAPTDLWEQLLKEVTKQEP